MVDVKKYLKIGKIDEILYYIEEADDKLEYLYELKKVQRKNTAIDLMIAKTYMDYHMYLEAERVYNNLCKMEEPLKSFGNLGKGRIKSKQFHFDEAMYYYNQIQEESDIKVSAYIEIAKILIFKGNYNEADILLEKTDKLLGYLKKTDLSMTIKRKKDLTSELNQIKSVVYFLEGDIPKAYKYITKATETEKGKFDLYLLYKMGMLETKVSSENIEGSYFLSQLVNYNKESSKKHIIKHFTEKECESNEALEKVSIIYDKIEEEISKTDPYFRFFRDNYFVYYPDGININGKHTYYIRVITFPGTKNIITAFPWIYALPKKNNIDLDMVDEDKTVSKRLSQIDKFNKRLTKKKVK